MTTPLEPPLLADHPAIVKGARLIVYPVAPHGLTDTHKDKVNADLLAFARS
jgi:non-heme chloroperoxidase